jgi:hypothetical protein
MVPEKQITELIGRLADAAGANLKSVILYGSAAAGDYVPEHSDLNLVCVLDETSFATIEALAPVVEWWGKQKHHSPLLMTEDELRRGADVFSIEFLDMQQNYRVLWGADLLKGLEIPMKLHRAQVEYELREKTILLRQRLLVVAGDTDAKWDLLLRSVSTFATLARHALRAMGESAVLSKREAMETLKARTNFDASAFQQVFDVRERKVDRKTMNVDQLFARYLKAVGQLTAAVDGLPD